MSSEPFRIRGAHVLTALLAFFAAIVAVNVSFAVFAVRSFPGEDVRRSYLQGLNYNATLADRRAQAALGWRATASLVNADGAAAVEVILQDGSGRPIEGLVVSGDLRWPANERFDRTLAFEPRADGRYVAAVRNLAAGRWVLRARAGDAEGRARDFEAELTWP